MGWRVPIASSPWPSSAWRLAIAIPCCDKERMGWNAIISASVGTADLHVELAFDVNRSSLPDLLRPRLSGTLGFADLAATRAPQAESPYRRRTHFYKQSRDDRASPSGPRL